MSASATTARIPETEMSAPQRWSGTHSYWLLTALTLLCLLPFAGRAFHVDDPLFIWAGQQIQKHPLDPYGFQVQWDNYSEPMSEVTKNPPLACYYAAAVGSIAGWSEYALHLGFLPFAIAVVLGTYRLAARFSRSPLVAAAATLLTPGIMVSASSVMCDTMMLAFWIWAVILWVEGFDEQNWRYLAASGFLIAVATLTKYFAISLVPLLLVYSIARKRRLGIWACYLAIPVASLTGYEFWTSVKYGHAMFSQALQFSHQEQGVNGRASFLANTFVGASFAGGCALPVLALAPFIWRWKKIFIALLLGGACSLTLGRQWVGLGHYAASVVESFRTAGITSGLQLALLIATGLGVLALALSEVDHWHDSDSLLLGLTVLGTFTFAAFLNWGVNARSVLPMIPAIGILIARRIDQLHVPQWPHLQRRVGLALAFCAAISIWLAKADSDWANAGRQAAEVIHQETQNHRGAVWFQGHWGFQYYMQLWGARPMDFTKSETRAGDLLIVPESNAVSYPLPSQQYVASSGLLELDLQQPIFTMRWRRGAGFYSSFYGFMPFAFAPPAKEQYYVLRLSMPWDAQIVRTTQN